jgi:adenosine deaminase
MSIPSVSFSTSHPRALTPARSLSSLSFGNGGLTASSLPIKAGNYSSRDRIPDDVYALLNKAPKNEIHVHQGGSSSVEFLSYSLRAAVAENQKMYDRKHFLDGLIAQAPQLAEPLRQINQNLFANAKPLDEFPVFQAEGAPKMVRFTEPDGQPLPAPALRAAMEEAFTLDNLRTYHRYQLESDNQKNYKDTNDISETTATGHPKNEMVSATESAELQQHKAEGLQAYRQTSGKINPFVKNNPAAYKLANEYAKSMAFENIRYTEYRVSPSGNGIGGANGSHIEDVLSPVHRGFEDAKQHLAQRNYQLDYGLIVLFERQNRNPLEPQDMKVRRAIELAQRVVQLKKEGKYNICGVDLAGDEAKNPVTEFKAAFDIIKAYNRAAAPENRLGITIHAGETPTSIGPKDTLEGHESIDQAIQMAHDQRTPVRIGHGLQIVNSSDELQKAFKIYRQFPSDWETRIDKAKVLASSPLLTKVIQDRIVLEMCPKSNLQTYGIHPGFPGEQFSVRRDEYSAEAYKRHPAVFLSRLGVKVAISSDNRTISNTDVTNEFVKLFKYAGLTYTDFKQMVLNGFEGAFIGDSLKKGAILQDVERQFKKMETDSSTMNAIDKMGGDPTRKPGPTPLSPWRQFKTGLSMQWQAFRQAVHLWWHQLKNFLSTPFKRKSPAGPRHT